jgi:16S rRNA (adenine1518-N6/adenine1519-N6)-dimethyltransferase
LTFPGHLLAVKNLTPKKQLGQNFLVDPSTAEMIVRRAGISVDDAVVEIGAGLGALSIPLAGSARIVYAVEKDRDLIEILSGVLSEKKIANIVLLNKNIFDLEIEEIARGEQCKLKLAGNLPYNVSSQIVMWAIDHRHIIESAVFMLQKEMARRISAPAGSDDYGRLSVMVQYFGGVEKIARINAHQFYPRPKVDSEVIGIRFKNTMDHPAADETLFSAVVKAAFGKRRKTLRNALANSDMDLEPRILDCLWAQSSIDPGRRAETLSVAEFVDLSDALKQCIEG